MSSEFEKALAQAVSVYGELEELADLYQQALGYESFPDEDYENSFIYTYLHNTVMNALTVESDGWHVSIKESELQLDPIIVAITHGILTENEGWVENLKKNTRDHMQEIVSQEKSFPSIIGIALHEFFRNINNEIRKKRKIRTLKKSLREIN